MLAGVWICKAEGDYQGSMVMVCLVKQWIKSKISKIDIKCPENYFLKIIVF